MDVVHARCAGIDVSKRDAKVCVRIQASGKRRTASTVTTWGAVTSQILALREHLIAQKVTCVVMEATSDYWRPFYYLLEEHFEVMLVNARRQECAGPQKRCLRCRVAGRSGRPRAGAGLVRASAADPGPA